MHRDKTLSIIFLITFLFAVTSLNFYPAEAQVQPAGKPLTNNDIISLARAGLSDAVIVSAIQKSPTQFDLGPEALINLKKAGVSNTVIETMIGGGGPLPAESAQVPLPVEEESPPPPPPPDVPEAPPETPPGAPPPPPPIKTSEPELVVLPGTYVYLCPGIVGADIFFYNGFWYRPHGEYWYRSSAYNGAWVPIVPPPIFLRLPRDYRIRAHEFPHIKYHEFQHNWRGWQRERHWEHHEQWKRQEHWYREHQQGLRPPPRPTPPPKVTLPPGPTPPPKLEKPAPPKPEKPAPPKLEKPAPPKLEKPVPPKPEKPVPPKLEKPVPPSKEEERK